MAAIERELVACGTGYALIELQSLQTQFEEREKKVDRKFELLTELFYNVDERNEENAAEIKEIKKNGRKNLRDVDQQIKKFNVKNWEKFNKLFWDNKTFCILYRPKGTLILLDTHKIYNWTNHFIQI